MNYKSYVTDLHLNIHPNQLDLLEKWYEHSKKKSDFFTIAYYPYQMIDLKNGYRTEEEIPEAEMNEQWQRIAEFLRQKNQKDHFISFLGFEWQGSGLDGDHNIYFKDDFGPISMAQRYQELVQKYKGTDTIGIPHHLAYSKGHRGKNWETHNEEFSPFVEIYSHHGSSESDQTNLLMERHIHMGPRIGGTTVMDGLKQGYHFGIIASGDNHEVPALVKNGRAGIWATEYTKDGLWDAFINRRTFGFTDSKITVWTSIGDCPMGSIISATDCSKQLDWRVEANGKIERIELYKNTELEEIYVIKNKNDYRSDLVTFKFKFECGWGPNVKFFPHIFQKQWEGSVETSGKILSVEPIFNSFNNDFTIEDNQKRVHFNCLSQKATGEDHWMRDASMKNEGFIVEIQTERDALITLTVDEYSETYTVDQILEQSHLIIFEEEAKNLVQEKTGLVDFPRSDGWYHNAYKVKIYQGTPEENYRIQGTFNLSAPSEGENSYFIKVIQQDGQVAWASPIWIRA
ncbi:hypothetical protein [Enterococcus sp.]|uniref:hypothetical protein n=1 Tax=Enterococcus sp. TaxID=35783 RepID=UPI002FC786F7